MGTFVDVGEFGLQKSQGKIARGEAEVGAKAEEAAGVAREADRKEKLIEALASQNAAAGAGGIAAFEGSPLSVMKEDTRREEQATQRDLFQTNLRALTLRTKGKIAEKQAKAAATLGLISDIEESVKKIFSSIYGGGMGGGG